MLQFEVAAKPCTDLIQYNRLDYEKFYSVNCNKTLFPLPTVLAPTSDTASYHNGIFVGDKLPQLLSFIPCTTNLFIIWLMNFNINSESELEFEKPVVKIGRPDHCSDNNYLQLYLLSHELDLNGIFQVKRLWNVFWSYQESFIESTFGCINRLRILVYLTEQGIVSSVDLSAFCQRIACIDLSRFEDQSVAVDFVKEDIIIFSF
ncbi:hypothetical protein GEMRC1_007979 [Eukaryota sp. GEM-RC1]